MKGMKTPVFDALKKLKEEDSVFFQEYP